MAQPGVRPYFNPGLAVLPLTQARTAAADSSLSSLVDLTRWLKGVTYTQEANIGDATAVGDRSMGKSTGKPDNGNLDVEIMRSYSSSGPMTTLQKFVSFPAICIWTDDVGADAALNTVFAGDDARLEVANTNTSTNTANPNIYLDTDDVLGNNDHEHDQYRFAICYITGIVHTDGNVQNADASSMSMSWPVDGDVYIVKTDGLLGNAEIAEQSTAANEYSSKTAATKTISATYAEIDAVSALALSTLWNTTSAQWSDTFLANAEILGG